MNRERDIMAGSAPGPDIALAARLFDELRQRTAASRGISRASYGSGEQIGHDLIRREARRLGLDLWTDAACNLFATLPGRRDGPVAMLGSHLDSVPLGGNYDGAAGVLLGLSVIAGLRAADMVPPVPITLAVLRAEESTWFGTSYIGSRAVFGLLTGAELDGVRRSDDGVTLGAAIAAAGGDPERLRAGRPSFAPGRIGLFLEAHIEQGPVLLRQGRSVGIVTGIRGSFRHRRARCLGAYSHSGATPREDRQDAVRAVARLVVAIDDAWSRMSRQGHDLTVTFGQLATDPEEASFSKVAGLVRFSVDVRSDSETTLALMQAELARQAVAIEADGNVRFTFGEPSSTAPAAMSPGVVEALAAAAARSGIDADPMPCGAGHDAAVFAQAGIPTGMVFIRNANGSHNPAEAMEMADFADAARLVFALLQDPPLMQPPAP